MIDFNSLVYKISCWALHIYVLSMVDAYSVAVTKVADSTKVGKSETFQGFLLADARPCLCLLSILSGKESSCSGEYRLFLCSCFGSCNQMSRKAGG